MTIGRVAQLWRYPVKSLGGEQVEQTEFGPRGVLGDRLWAIRDLERDVTASARQLPVLLTATARYVGPLLPDAGPGNVPEVEIAFPDGAVIGARSLIAAHSLVVGGTKIPDEVLVTGSPAKVRGPIAGTGAQMWVDTNPGAYQDLARRYVEGLRPIT